jgi:hypothetical protein
MNEDLGQLGCPPAPVFSVHPLAEIENTWPDNVPPTLVSNTMFRRIEWECRNVIRVNRVANETASSVSVEPDHKEEREVVGVPERFEALFANLMVCGRIHQKHNKKHEVASDSAGLCVVDIQGNFLADLCKTI